MCMQITLQTPPNKKKLLVVMRIWFAVILRYLDAAVWRQSLLTHLLLLLATCCLLLLLKYVSHLDPKKGCKTSTR